MRNLENSLNDLTSELKQRRGEYGEGYAGGGEERHST